MIKLIGIGNIEVIAKDLKKGMIENAATCDLKEWMQYPGAEGEIHVQVYEQYYNRVSSYVSLTVVLADRGKNITAELVGSGGGGGLFNISWGANETFAENAANVLRGRGFRVVRETAEE